MTENYIKPQDVSPQDAQKVLNFLNSVQSAEEIDKAVEIPDERDVGIRVGQRILDRRKELGNFTNLQQIADIPQIGPERFTEIVTTLREREELMSKLITVNREKLKASLEKHEKLRAKDKQWQKEKKKMEEDEAKEKTRRDAEFAAKQKEEQQKEGE